jgi:hypothetical protein
MQSNKPHHDGSVALGLRGPYLERNLPDEELPLVVLVIAADLLAKHAVGAVAAAQTQLPKALRAQIPAQIPVV